MTGDDNLCCRVNDCEAIEIGTWFLRSAGGGDGGLGESGDGGRGSIETLGIGSGGLSITMMVLITFRQQKTNERLDKEE